VDNSQPTVLPDGSAFAVVSFPLPPDHWSRIPGENVPPVVLSTARHLDASTRQWWRDRITDAARYAYRCASFNGRVGDIDPDALIMQLVVGFIGEEPTAVRYELTSAGRDALEEESAELKPFDS
jgi:hypothetical protein